MANNYAPLNRNNTWDQLQKRAIKKAFVAAETAAAAGDHTYKNTNRTLNSQILDPRLDGNEAHSIKRLLDGIADAIVAADNTYDVVPHITGFLMTSSKKRVIKALAEETVAQIV
jgi:hypothetical protein